jgi:hypothetical protein
LTIDLPSIQENGSLPKLGGLCQCAESDCMHPNVKFLGSQTTISPNKIKNLSFNTQDIDKVHNIMSETQRENRDTL